MKDLISRYRKQKAPAAAHDAAIALYRAHHAEPPRQALIGWAVTAVVCCVLALGVTYRYSTVGVEIRSGSPAALSFTPLTSVSQLTSVSPLTSVSLLKLPSRPDMSQLAALQRVEVSSSRLTIPRMSQLSLTRAKSPEKEVL